MAERTRHHDWAASPLGEPDTWPDSLRTLTEMVLATREPCFLAWGPQRIVIYNDHYAPLCGSKHPAALGRPFDEIWSDIIEEARPVMDRTYGGEAVHMDDIAFTMHDRHGYAEETHFAFSYLPVRDRTDTVQGMICTCRETTDAVLTQRQLSFQLRLGDLLRPLTDAAEVKSLAVRLLAEELQAGMVAYGEILPGGIAVTGTCHGDGSLPMSTGVPQPTGPMPTAIAALSSGARVVLDDLQENEGPIAAEIREACITPGLRAFAAIPLIKNRQLAAYLYVGHATPRRWSPQALELAQDVAERTWAAAERATTETDRTRAEEALQEADRRKDEFLATLAHELRNPLAPIRSAARISSEPNVTPEQLRWSHAVIERQVRNMALLLDDLLDVSRITRGILEVRKTPTAAADIVEAALETSRPVIAAREHRLVVEVADETLHVDADPLRLAQALSNLLTNAAKYTDPGGTIHLTAQREGDSLVLRVRDSGIGIASTSLERIFAMFSQVEPALERSEGGLGIGLALVKGIVELHGGTVQASSAGLGRGSEFVLKIPQVHTGPVPVVPAPVAAAPVARGPLRVALADDNVDGAETLAALLELDGYEVRIAHDGLAALDLVREYRPDAVFLDIGMPGLNGYEVARQLRLEQAPGDTPPVLVALTGWGGAEDKKRALEAGFDRHLTKPVDPDALVHILVEAAQQRAVPA